MKVYFKNLDGLRFIAALFVILEHVAEYKASMVPGYSNVFHYYFVELGRYGVDLFFVLSGFLITYLLLTELAREQKIAIQKFYARRMLRTWPLYLVFGTVVICLFDFVLKRTGGDAGNSPVATNLAYLYTFSINLQLLFTAYNRGIFEIAWSICIEEQFYLVWPWIIRNGAKQVRSWIMIFIFAGVACGVLLHLLVVNNIMTAPRNPVYIFTLCRFSTLAIGAYCAYILFYKGSYRWLIKLVSNKVVQAIVISVALLLSFNIINLPSFFTDYLLDVAPALIFGFIVLSAVSGNCIFNLEKKWLKLFGKYSYGIYLFHPSIAQLILLWFKKVLPNSFFNYDILYVALVIAVTILTASASYQLFEIKFLQLKQRFTVVRNQPV